jgi:hypothetical protein
MSYSLREIENATNHRMLFPEPAVRSAVNQIMELIKSRGAYVSRGSTEASLSISMPQRYCLHRTTRRSPRVDDRMQCCGLWMDQKEIAIL